MPSVQARVFDLMRNLSTGIAVLSLMVGGIFTFALDSDSMSWQVGLALLALAVGIPHGALDHLVSMPRGSMTKMIFFIVVYILIAVGAVIAIMSWNVAGFYLVVLMSALHFGIGDTAFLAERDRLHRKPPAPRWAQCSYAIAAGSTPVIIPLVNERSTNALAMVNPSLVDWHRGADSWLMYATLSLLLIALITQLLMKRNREVLDLLLLGLIALFLPPLVAFAIYFGTWHAFRHTARLTLGLASSQEAFEMGDGVRALRAAIVPGLPALIATIGVAMGIVVAGGSDLSDDFLWTLLVVIWALTVPHMMVTARLDKRALAKQTQ
jgi:Brp/Blh family beta-carotene 15,15'-monooxygenase